MASIPIPTQQQQPQQSNGRATFGDNSKPYGMFANDDAAATANVKTCSREPLRGIFTSNSLSDIFFSDVNVDAVQTAIRYRVYVDSGRKYTIGRQSDTELQIIMRSIYFQFSKNQPINLTGQVKELNKKVLDYTVPRIIQEINQYNQYKHDVTTMPVPLQRSENVSNAGSKFLFRGDF